MKRLRCIFRDVVLVAAALLILRAFSESDRILQPGPCAPFFGNLEGTDGAPCGTR